MSDTEETKQHPMPDAAATLTFNLDTPGGRFAHRCACRGGEMLLLLWDLDQEMRGCVKHGSGPSDGVGSVDMRDGIEIATQHWRDRLRDLAHDHGVDLEDDV
jgi:hypothetical protein